MPKIIRLNEAQLKKIIIETMNNIISENIGPCGGYTIYKGSEISPERAYEEAVRKLSQAKAEKFPICSVIELIDYQKFDPNSFSQEDWEVLYDANEIAFHDFGTNCSINEHSASIKSHRLLNLIKLHGGIYKNYPQIHKDYRAINADLHNLRDDDILDVVKDEDIDTVRKKTEMIWALRKKYPWLADELNSGSSVEFLNLNDGTAIALVSKGESNDVYGTWNKIHNRRENRKISSKDYVPISPTNQATRQNPYYPGNKYWSKSDKEWNREKMNKEYDKAKENRPNLPDF